MSNLPHMMFSASAGSGKTYQLVRRYLHLLMLDVDPRQIAAMTFTRKAAGEFFNRILRRLAELADGKIKPEAYFAGLEPLPDSWPDFALVMRRLLRHMHRLRLGTLDSFFAAIAASFPLELGLPVGASVMADDAADRALDEALSALLERAYRQDSAAEARTLLESWKLGTFGREDKTVLRSLDDWIKKAHPLWLDCPLLERWGNVDAIWPKNDADQPLIWQGDVELSALADQLAKLGAAQNWSDDGHAKWQRMVEQAQQFSPGLKLEKPLAELLEKCGENWTALRAGSAEFLWQRRKTTFAGAAAQLLVQFVSRLAAAEFKNRAVRTQGVARVMAIYEQGYHRLVRQQGRLSFADVQRLLADAQERREAGIFNIAKGADLWFRLDSRHDHWLFDEFQDTSVQQWQVVRDLVDEVIQDTSGRRSFFAVGDIKQSIYLWRRAEPGLFHHVADHYSRAGRLQTQPLARSQRSCQQVLDAVNTTFGDKTALETLLPGALGNWEFTLHESAKPELRGHVALLQCGKKAADEDDPRHVLMAELLKMVRPLERGLSCAILVNSNKTAAELAEFLRASTGQDVVSESQQQPATDNPVTLALLAVLQLAAHPGDRFALEHLRMTPLGSVLSGEFGGSAERLAADTLAVVQDHGFAEFAGHWSRRIQTLTESGLDDFSAHRLAQFAEIAREFDDNGGRSVDEFIAFAQEHGMSGQGKSAAVQVMTIHKSKGLEFDVVLLPDLDGNGMMATGALDLVTRQPLFGRPEWVLQMPVETFSDLDPTLKDIREQRAQREGFEALCQLYVAMTRARLGLYLLIKPPPDKKPGAASEARLLREQLSKGRASAPIQFGDAAAECLASLGDANWYEERKPQSALAPEPPAVPGQTIGALLRELQPLPRRVTPSDEEAFHVTGATLFAPERESGRQLGSLVHELLAEIEWADAGSAVALPKVWQARLLDRQTGYAAAAEQVQALLADAELRQVFARPAGRCELWRERSFDLLHEGRWVSGVMDRVLVEQDAGGSPAAVWLVDFKTDVVADDEQIAAKVAGYRPQIDLYREALRRLTGLPPERIRASLIFTRPRREAAL